MMIVRVLGVQRLDVIGSARVLSGLRHSPSAQQVCACRSALCNDCKEEQTAQCGLLVSVQRWLYWQHLRIAGNL
jgi:hypothetical protein